MSVPPPPPAERLADFPIHHLSPDDVICRIVRRYDDLGQVRAPLFFSSSGLGRFDPPAGHAAGYGTCYFAREEIAAFIERFGRYRVILQDVVEAHELIRVTPQRGLRLADVSSSRVLGAYGLTREICTVAPDYDMPQRWSAALHEAGFDGIWYGPRHDPAGNLRAAALFGPAGERQPAEAGLRVLNQAPMPHGLLLQAAHEFGLYVVSGDQP